MTREERIKNIAERLIRLGLVTIKDKQPKPDESISVSAPAPKLDEV